MRGPLYREVNAPAASFLKGHLILNDPDGLDHEHKLLYLATYLGESDWSSDESLSLYVLVLKPVKGVFHRIGIANLYVDTSKKIK